MCVHFANVTWQQCQGCHATTLLMSYHDATACDRLQETMQIALHDEIHLGQDISSTIMQCLVL